MLDEKEAELYIERQQRVNDLLLMRNMDNKPGVERYIITDVLYECNKRIIEYVFQFKAFSLGFLTLQTIQDFSRYLIVLQAKKLDVDKPVALLRDDNHTKIFVNRNISRISFEESTEGNPIIYFLKEEEIGR